MQKDKKIFVDTDFISCFLRVNETSVLEKMYPDYLILVPEAVEKEILVNLKYLDDLHYKYYQEIANGVIKQCDPIMTDSEEFEMLIKLKTVGIDNLKPIGSGEAEAITLAVKRNGVLASNNLRDVQEYVKHFSLEHITTAEVLFKAYDESYLSKDKVNRIWGDMIALNRKLPTKTFDEYIMIRKGK